MVNTSTPYRDSLGRFVKGRCETKEEHQKRMDGVKNYYGSILTVNKIRSENPRIFNSWRAMWYTQKGKQCGCSEETWKDYRNFYFDVSPFYVQGANFHRLDTSKPFSKDNFIWLTEEAARQLDKKHLINLTYNGETLSIKEWAVKYNLSVNGIKGRYHKHRNDYTVEEIIFGKHTKRGSKKPKDAPKDSQQERDKASKMISSYRAKDKKHGLPVCDIDIEWMIHNIIRKQCVYCGDTHRVGCDRIDNNKGHTKDNVVPCCYECNTVRGDRFTYEEMRRLGALIRNIKEERRKDNHNN